MSESAEDSVQCWTAKRPTALIMGILKGETSIPEAARDSHKKQPRKANDTDL